MAPQRACEGKGGFNARDAEARKGLSTKGDIAFPASSNIPTVVLAEGETFHSYLHISIVSDLGRTLSVESDDQKQIDGKSLLPLLQNRKQTDWSPRTLCVHSQRIEHPEKWRKSAVMTRPMAAHQRKRIVSHSKRPQPKKQHRCQASCGRQTTSS